MTQDLSAVAWPVTTERLVIRPGTLEDADAVHGFRSRPEVNEWITRVPGEPGAFRLQWADPVRMSKTLVVEHDGLVVGDLMIAVQDPYAQAEVADQAVGLEAELGWVLDPTYGGRGLATEAVRAAIEICLGPLGLRRVVAHCFADNEPSWRLMERVGMRREAVTVRDALHRSGEWLDGLSYALLAEEWGALRKSHSVADVTPRP